MARKTDTTAQPPLPREILGQPLERLDEIDWSGVPSPADRERALNALESGRIVFCPKLPFALVHGEQRFLDPSCSDRRHKNISFEPQTSTLGGTKLKGQDRDDLARLLARFSDHAEALLCGLFPRYAPYLERGRASLRTTGIDGRHTSFRKDDRRLHADAFPSQPTGGRRILRIFCNINPDGAARVWQVGEPFADWAQRFMPRRTRTMPITAPLLATVGITKGRRTDYDRVMLLLHDRSKADIDYQRDASRAEIMFPSGSTWIVFTDVVLHAAIAGQHALEQTFYLPVSAMSNPEAAPLSILERLTGRCLVPPLEPTAGPRSQTAQNSNGKRDGPIKGNVENEGVMSSEAELANVGVSFVMPIFNKARYLPAVLQALKNQTGDFRRQYIFIDDGSTDGSLEVVRDATRAWPNIVIETQPNGGACAATNRGIALATEPYIKFVDADDILLPDATRVLVDAIIRTGCALAYGLATRYRQIEKIDVTERFETDPVPTVIKHPLLLVLRNAPFNPTQILVRTDLVRGIGGCDERLIHAQDYSLAMRLAARSSFVRVDRMVAHCADDGLGGLSADLRAQHKRSNQACALLLRDHPELPVAIKRYAFRRAVHRVRRWRWRVGSPRLTLSLLWLYIRSALPIPGDYAHLIEEASRAFDPVPSAATWQRYIVREFYTAYLAAKDRRVSWHARLIALLGLAYFWSPVDLIPNRIPIIGYLDEATVVSLCALIALRFIPANLRGELHAAADAVMRVGEPAL